MTPPEQGLAALGQQGIAADQKAAEVGRI
jgi:hypothetical protein